MVLLIFFAFNFISFFPWIQIKIYVTNRDPSTFSILSSQKFTTLMHKRLKSPSSILLWLFFFYSFPNLEFGTSLEHNHQSIHHTLVGLPFVFGVSAISVTAQSRPKAVMWKFRGFNFDYTFDLSVPNSWKMSLGRKINVRSLRVAR